MCSQAGRMMSVLTDRSVLAVLTSNDGMTWVLLQIQHTPEKEHVSLYALKGRMSLVALRGVPHL